MADRKYSFDWEKITKGIIEKETKGGGNKDTDGRFYKIKAGEDGNAEVKFRFIPPKDFAEIGSPYVKWFHHDVNINGKRLFLMCPTTLGNEKECPICQEYLDNWETDKKYAKIFKRKTNVVANILIISDPQHPENVGKIFLYRFGIQILEKILGAMNPPKLSTDPPIVVFDYYEGANFKLKLKTKEVPNDDGSKDSMPSYEDSYFEGKSELDEKYIDFAYENAFPLGEFIKTEKFDIEEEVKQKFEVFVEKSKGKSSTSKSSSHVEYEKKEEKVKDEIVEEKFVAKDEIKVKDEIVEEKFTSRISEPEPVKTSTPALNLEDDDEAFWAKVKNKNK